MAIYVMYTPHLEVYDGPNWLNKFLPVIINGYVRVRVHVCVRACTHARVGACVSPFIFTQ